MRRQNSWFLAPILTLILLLSLVAALVGCGSSGDGGGGGGDAVTMMKKMPKDAGYSTFINIAAFRADKDLDKVYEDSKDSLVSDFEDLGISAADVDTMAMGSSVTILEGNSSLQDVRAKLEDNGYKKGEYKGIETWEGDLSVALVSATCIVVGEDTNSMQDCIDVIKGDADSLYDDADMRDLIGRLPAGGLGISVSSSVGYLEGCKAMGLSEDKKDADTLRMAMIFLFEDEDAASAATSDIEDQYKSTGYENASVTHNGKYVTASADVAIEDVVS